MGTGDESGRTVLVTAQLFNLATGASHHSAVACLSQSQSTAQLFHQHLFKATTH